MKDRLTPMKGMDANLFGPLKQRITRHEHEDTHMMKSNGVRGKKLLDVLDSWSVDEISARFTMILFFTEAEPFLAFLQSEALAAPLHGDHGCPAGCPRSHRTCASRKVDLS